VLRSHGDDDEAKAAYVDALTKQATFACGSEGLKKLAAKDVWSQATLWIGRVGTVYGALALAIVALATVFFLGKAARRGPPQLQIKAFDDTGLDPHMGPGFAELVRTDLLDPASYGPQIDVVTGEAAASTALDALAGALPDAAKPAAGFLSAAQALSRPRLLTLTGALHPQAYHGFGVTVGMAGASSYSASGDLWGDALQIPVGDDAANAVQRMAAPAAGYARHVYSSQTDHDPVMGRDPYAFAQFRAAQESHVDGHYDEALALCNSALDRDDTCALARGLRGQIYAQQGKLDEAVTDLDDAIGAVAGNG
jgi:hypothetical protein